MRLRLSPVMKKFRQRIVKKRGKENLFFAIPIWHFQIKVFIKFSNLEFEHIITIIIWIFFNEISLRNVSYSHLNLAAIMTSVQTILSILNCKVGKIILNDTCSDYAFENGWASEGY